MKEEYLICGAPLKYLDTDERMELPSATKRRTARPGV